MQQYYRSLYMQRYYEIFPDLADAKIVRTWAGWADQMKDGVPVLGNVSEVPGLVLATGFCGHGFGIAPAIGHELADLIVDGKHL